MDDSDDLGEIIRNLSALPADPPIKRDVCLSCCRPVTVCWCPYLPLEPLNLSCTVVILQHPSEEKRCLRTAPILLAALPAGKCHIIQGRKFTPAKSVLLENILSCRNTLLLFPSLDAIDILDIPPIEDKRCPYNLVILDGTWAQARSIYHTNPTLKRLKRVKLSNTGLSEYVIRTQPSDSCLSTVETAAIALSILENNDNIRQVLLKPLQALCKFQLQHGAVEHQSKEFLIQNGQKKRITKKSKKRKKKDKGRGDHCEA